MIYLIAAVLLLSINGPIYRALMYGLLYVVVFILASPYLLYLVYILLGGKDR
jgi:hypothetical protein